MAAKKAVIDWDKVDQHLQARCSGAAIARQLGIHSNTLYQRCKEDKGVEFVTYQQEKRAEGDDMLRLAQFKEAVKGNTSMLIWLGKQYLEQKDKSESDNRQDLTLTIKREVKVKDGA